MSSASERKHFATDRPGFRERQSAALRWRLDAGITGKSLAYGIGVHPDTVMNWVNGRSTMDGTAIAAVDAFFSSRGDPGFLTEIFQPTEPRKEPTRSTMSADRCLWFTGEGMAHDAPFGHADFVCEALHITSLPDDLPGYAIRNLGWVECVVRSDGRIGLRYAVDIAEPAAVIRARDWILTEGGNATEVEASVWQNGEWVHYSSMPLSDMARLLDRASVTASFDRMSEHYWNVARLPLDSLIKSAMTSLITNAKEGSNAVQVAFKLGVMDTSSIFSIDGENVVSLWIGPKLGLPAELLVHRNVLDRTDRNYAALVHHHVLEAVREGPTFYRLDIDIVGRRRHYERVAVRQGPNLVITSSMLLEQGVAA